MKIKGRQLINLQEAADLILLDKFSAIITGIEYGRLCFENLRKSILYLLPAGKHIFCSEGGRFLNVFILAGSFSELMPVLLNVLFGEPDSICN